MSTTSKVTLFLSCVASAGIIYWVHFKQMEDREKMHRGVLRDMEVLEMKRRQNIQDLNQQVALTQMLKEQEKKTKEVPS